MKRKGIAALLTMSMVLAAGGTGGAVVSAAEDPVTFKVAVMLNQMCIRDRSSAVCTPSRYSILTGRYNWRSRLKSSVVGGYSEPLLEKGRKTVADLFREQGYHTAMVGKWHLGMNFAKTLELSLIHI